MSWKLGYAQREFIGFSNYLQLFGSADFWNAMANTAIYTGLMGGLSIALGLGLSLAVVSTTRLTSMWQAMFFLPVCHGYGRRRRRNADRPGVELPVDLRRDSAPFTGRRKRAAGPAPFN